MEHNNFDFRNTDSEDIDWKEVIGSAAGLVVAVAATVLVIIALYLLASNHQPLP